MKQPDLHPSVRLAQGAVVCGDVTIGANSSLWFNAVLRTESEPILVGENTNIQDNCIVHIDASHPAVIGSNVTVGHGVILHGCTVGDGTLIGMGAIVLNGAKIGKNCIIGAGSLVTQNTVIPDGSMAFGSPAKVIRPLRPEELAANAEAASDYVETSLDYVRRGYFHLAGGNAVKL